MNNTTLDHARLKNVHSAGAKIIAQCPACAEAGGDKAGEHLVITEAGKFGCIKYQGPDGEAHRKRIFAMVGLSAKREQPRPTHRKARTWPDPEAVARAYIRFRSTRLR